MTDFINIDYESIKLSLTKEINELRGKYTDGRNVEVFIKDILFMPITQKFINISSVSKDFRVTSAIYDFLP